MKPKERATLNKENASFVFQQFYLLNDLTGAGNPDMPLSYQNVRRGERQPQVADMLDQFGIVAKEDLYPSQLSGGQQQLVAVISYPIVFLADEPTGNLHTDQGRESIDSSSGSTNKGR